MSGFNPVRATAQFVLGSTTQKARPLQMLHIASIARGAREFATHNSPAILTGVAIAGVATTAILAVRATKPALIDIQHAESEREEPLTKSEVVKLCWKYYIPAAGVGVVTIACVIGAQSVNTRRHAALISAYTLSEKSFTELQDKVEETFGKNKAERVKDDIAQDNVNATPPVKEQVVVVTASADHLFRDGFSGQYFRSTVDRVDKAVNKINYDLNNNAHASLNDFYGYLEIANSDMGDDLGWKSDVMLEAQRSVVMAGDEPCIVITLSHPPVANYWKFGG